MYVCMQFTRCRHLLYYHLVNVGSFPSRSLCRTSFPTTCLANALCGPPPPSRRTCTCTSNAASSRFCPAEITCDGAPYVGVGTHRQFVLLVNRTHRFMRQQQLANLLVHVVFRFSRVRVHQVEHVLRNAPLRGSFQCPRDCPITYLVPLQHLSYTFHVPVNYSICKFHRVRYVSICILITDKNKSTILLLPPL